MAAGKLKIQNELFVMFRYPSMIKAAAFCAAVFGLLAVLLKNSIVFIPEVTEVRICNIVAMGFGIFFGPAGAWGVALGNVIGDMSGSLSNLSPEGFFGNFLTAWIPYKVWCIFGSKCGDAPTARPSLKSKWFLQRAIVAEIITLVACPAIIAIACDFTNTMPIVNFSLMLFFNNAGANILGILFFMAMCALPAKALPYWRDLMSDERSLAFPAHDIKYVVIMLVLSILVILATGAYLLENDLGLSVMDEFGNMAFIVGYSVYLLAIFVLGYICTWKPIAKDTIIEL